MEERDKPEYLVYFSLFSLLAMGMAAIYGATRPEPGESFVIKQTIWIMLGLLVFSQLRNYEYRHYAVLANRIYWGGILMLLSVFVIGKKVNGAQSWIDLKWFSLQPSELARITTLVLLARMYEQFQGEFRRRADIARVVLLLGFPTGLVLLQPDLGMALVYLSLLGCFLVMSKLDRFVHITYITSTISIALFLYGLHAVSPEMFYQIVRPHQIERITSFLHPESDPLGSGYQYLQARSAVGSGQLGGTGMSVLFDTSTAKLPERHTDFIFAVIAQQWGFVGASTLLLLYLILFYRLIHWAMHTPDAFASFFISGMVTMWAFQVFVNIGMNIGLSPITGLTLPFISYGGSSLLSNMIALGMIFSMRKPSPQWELDQLP